MVQRACELCTAARITPEVADEHFGAIYIDDNMRNIPDHYHAHGRPKGGFFGRDFALQRLTPEDDM